MSIVRWGEDGSQVYVIRASADREMSFVCVACDGLTHDETSILQHMEWHRLRGDVVPDHVDGRIKAERFR